MAAAQIEIQVDGHTESAEGDYSDEVEAPIESPSPMFPACPSTQAEGCPPLPSRASSSWPSLKRLVSTGSGGSFQRASNLTFEWSAYVLASHRARLSRAGDNGANQLASFFVVVLIVFTDYMGFTILNPVIPFYVEAFEDAKDFGFGAATAMLTSSYAFTQLIATPLMGFASTRWGRKPMFLISLFGSFVGFLGQGCATSFKALVMMRLFTGLFAGTRPVSLQYIGDIVPPAKQPRYMGAISAAVSISVFAGPVLGGSLGLVELWLPCMFQSAICLVMVPLTYYFMLEPPKSRPDEQAESEGAQSSSSWKVWLLLNALVGFMSMFQMTAWSAILPIVASQKYELDQNKIGLIMGCVGLVIGLGQVLVFVPAAKRVTLPVIAIAGALLMGTGALVPVVEGLPVLVAMSVANGLGSTLLFPGLTIVVNLLAPATKRATITAASVTLQALARVVAPVVMGALYDEVDWAPHLAMAVVSLLMVLAELPLLPRVPMLRDKPRK